MKHHEIIAEMLKNRRNNTKYSEDLEDIQQESYPSKNYSSEIKLEDAGVFEDFGESIDNDKLDDSSKNYVNNNHSTFEDIERNNRLLKRLEKELSSSVDERCPICGSNLIDKGSGILQCEKVTCYYSKSKPKYFKSKLSDTEIYNRSFWG